MSVQRLLVEPTSAAPRQREAELSAPEHSAPGLSPSELSTDLCRALIRCNPDGVLILDLRGNIEFISQNGVEQHGLLDAASVLGGAWVSLWPQGERPKVRDALHKARQGQTARFEGICPTAAGARKWWSVVVSPLSADPLDGHGAFLCIVRDITALKLAQETSAQARRLEALGRLTGGVAHDFNNLLTIIMGATETLAEALDGQPEDQDLALVSLHAAEQGADQIRRLLAFARREPLAPQTIDGAAVLNGLGTMVGRLLPGDIVLHVSTPAAPLHCTADPGELEAAILNLCINSRDAMPNGGALDLAAEAVSMAGDAACAAGLAPGDYVVFTVKDDGVGMSAEALQRAVEPFFTTKRPTGGTGLGLSTVHSFARRSGGGLAITSQPGHGATVRLFMPRQNARRPFNPMTSNG